MSNPPRRRILVITRNYPPLRGGMERLVHRLTHELARDFDLALCGPAGCEAFAPTGTLVVGVPVRPLALFLARVGVAAASIARRFQPDLIIAGSGLTAPIARLTGTRRGIAAAVYLHGLDIVTRHPVYRSLWLPCIRRCDRFLVNSHYTAARAVAAGCAADRIVVLRPGTDLPEPDAMESAAAVFRARYALGDAPLLLAVGRLTPRKGLVEFIDLALPAIATAVPEVKLVVIGGEAGDALGIKAGSGLARIRQAAERRGVARHLALLGSCDDTTLAAAYAAASALVFPVLDLPGDAEGFGMVALEAAAHGRPTVAFGVGGVPDAVSEGESGWLVPAGDYAGFAARVITLLTATEPKPTPAQCIAFARTLSWHEFGARARAQCREFIDAHAVESA